MWRKRKFQRFEDPTSVRIKFYSVAGQDDLNGSTLECATHDISEGGICLTMNRDLPVDTPVKLRVAIADPPSSFTHHAEVRWTGEASQPGYYSAGLEFTGSSETHMEEWRRLLRCISSSVGAPVTSLRPAVQG